MKDNLWSIYMGVRGLIVSSEQPIRIGKFSFCNISKHKEYIAKENRTPKSNTMARISREIGYFYDLSSFETVVGVKVYANDLETARARATEKMKLLEATLRIYSLHEFDMISILEEVSIFNRHDEGSYQWLAISPEKNISYHYNVSGKCIICDIENISKDAADVMELISKCEYSQVERHAIITIIMLGRAYYDLMDAYECGYTISFVDAIMAIESLTSFGGHASTAQIVSNCVSMIAKTQSQAKIIHDEIKNLYRIRSEVVHGKRANVESCDVCSAIEYAKTILEKYIIIITANNISTDKELQNYLNERTESLI